MEIWILLILTALVAGFTIGLYAKQKRPSWIQPITFFTLGVASLIVLQKIAETLTSN